MRYWLKRIGILALCKLVERLAMSSLTLSLAGQEVSDVVRCMAAGENRAETLLRLSEIVGDLYGGNQHQIWLLRIRGRSQEITVYTWWRPATLYGYVDMRLSPQRLFRLVLVTDVGRFIMDPDYDGALVEWINWLIPPVFFFQRHILLVVRHRD